jgi:hypothetical protein
MKKITLFFSSILIVTQIVSAQVPTTTIATWKNDAKGAYNIIHDDFGDNGVIGIQNYADSMHVNRGLKFTFGAIASSCEGDPSIYLRAKSMIAYGHEIISHSHTHSCAVGSANCGGQGVNYQWAVAGATDNLAIEVDQAHTSIEQGTGHSPKFYIYPYDQFNDNANTYLKNKGYIGSRTGAYNAASSNTLLPDNFGFYKTPFVVDVQTVNGVTNAINLNYWVDQAITNKQWVNRELHNIGSSGWGSVTVSNYRTHLNYVKSKVVSGDLWVGTISEILTYQIQKTNYSNPITTYSSINKEINISWNAPSFDVAAYLAPLQIKTPVTLKVNLNGVSGLDYIITQAGKTISSKRVVNGVLYFDAFPHEGSIKISLTQCPDLCILSSPASLSVNQGANNTFYVSASGSSNISYQWTKNGVDIPNANSSSLSLTNIQFADSGFYAVKVSNGLLDLLSSSAKLTVNKIVIPPLTSPFGGTAALIPGTIQAENFDEGLPGNAFYDNTSINEGSQAAYRPGSAVDIDNCNDGSPCYNVGYATTGEWMNYTVDVAETKNYNLEIRYATMTAAPSIKLFMDNVAITSTVVLPSTSSWSKFKSVFVNNIPLTAGLNRIMKVQIMSSDADMNYFKFTPGTITDLALSDDLNVELNVYPNPAQDNFTIIGLRKGTVQLLSLEGSLIKEYKVSDNQNQIEVDYALEKGIYLIKYLGVNSSQTIRIVKI